MLRRVFWEELEPANLAGFGEGRNGKLLCLVPPPGVWKTALPSIFPRYNVLSQGNRQIDRSRATYEKDEASPHMKPRRLVWKNGRNSRRWRPHLLKIVVRGPAKRPSSTTAAAPTATLHNACITSACPKSRHGEMLRRLTVGGLDCRCRLAAVRSAPSP